MTDRISSKADVLKSLYGKLKYSRVEKLKIVTGAELDAASLENTNGICLRIRVNDFESISQTLQDYIDNLWIIPEKTDLLLDLTYIDDEICI